MPAVRGWVDYGGGELRVGHTNLKCLLIWYEVFLSICKLALIDNLSMNQRQIRGHCYKTFYSRKLYIL
jgi:hypothetical protein